MAQLDAATASEPAAEAASGLMALELVACSANVVPLGTPPTMYFMNGVPAPATRRIPIPSECVPLMVIPSNSFGMPLVMLLSSVWPGTRTPST